MTDAQKGVVLAMRKGAELIVHASDKDAALVVEGKGSQVIGHSVWRPVYALDLIRRGEMLASKARIYGLTPHGRTAALEPET